MNYSPVFACLSSQGAEWEQPHTHHQDRLRRPQVHPSSVSTSRPVSINTTSPDWLLLFKRT